MLQKNEIPSMDLVIRVVIYLVAMVVIGMSSSWTLGLMNTSFVVGFLGTMGNLLLFGLLARYILITHFTDNEEPPEVS